MLFYDFYVYIASPTTAF